MKFSTAVAVAVAKIVFASVNKENGIGNGKRGSAGNHMWMKHLNKVVDLKPNWQLKLGLAESFINSIEDSILRETRCWGCHCR